LKATVFSFHRLTLLCVIFIISGCATFKQQLKNIRGLSKCDFELDNIDKYISFKEHNGNIWNYVVSIDFNGMNPNDAQVKIANYKLELFVNDNHLTDLKSSDEILLAANETTTFNIKAVIAPSNALDILWKKLRNKRIEYRVRGTFLLKIGKISKPISLNLFKYVENGDE